MVNDFVDFSSFVRFNVLLLNSECKGTKKLVYMQKNSNNFSKNADLLVNVNFAVEQSRAFPLLSIYNSP